MIITLKQLNESFNSLGKIAGTEFPKEHFKISYKLARIWKSAQREAEEMQLALRDLHHACGFSELSSATPVQREDYFWREKAFLKSENAELWGDAFTLEQSQVILDLVSLSPADLANLDWLLVICDQLEPEPEKASVAQI